MFQSDETITVEARQKNFRGLPVVLGLDFFHRTHCTIDNGPGNGAKRIADDDSASSSAAVPVDDGQLNARRIGLDSGYCLVNPSPILMDLKRAAKCRSVAEI